MSRVSSPPSHLDFPNRPKPSSSAQRGQNQLQSENTRQGVGKSSQNHAATSPSLGPPTRHSRALSQQGGQDGDPAPCPEPSAPMVPSWGSSSWHPAREPELFVSSLGANINLNFNKPLQESCFVRDDGCCSGEGAGRARWHRDKTGRQQTSAGLGTGQDAASPGSVSPGTPGAQSTQPRSIQGMGTGRSIPKEDFHPKRILCAPRGSHTGCGPDATRQVGTRIQQQHRDGLVGSLTLFLCTRGSPNPSLSPLTLGWGALELFQAIAPILENLGRGGR